MHNDILNQESIHHGTNNHCQYHSRGWGTDTALGLHVHSYSNPCYGETATIIDQCDLLNEIADYLVVKELIPVGLESTRNGTTI